MQNNDQNTDENKTKIHFGRIMNEADQKQRDFMEISFQLRRQLTRLQSESIGNTICLSITSKFR